MGRGRAFGVVKMIGWTKNDRVEICCWHLVVRSKSIFNSEQSSLVKGRIVPLQYKCALLRNIGPDLSRVKGDAMKNIGLSQANWDI